MDRLRALFPEREFFMRSEGQVRFIRISSRLQIGAAALAAALLLAWVGTMAALAIGRFTDSHDRVSLLNREAKVATAERRVRAYRKDVKAVEADLARRQDFIEKMVQAHLGELPQGLQQDETASASSKEAGRTGPKISMAGPEAKGLARIEARQLSFVERLTRFADRRSEQDAEQIRKLGLNPGAMLASLDSSRAEGGPFQPLATGANGSIDPRFRRLGVSLARMDALERGLAGIPQVLPANLEFVSSGFGYRADPFTGAAAFHAGIDFPGPVGTPVYAAARGRVSFVGQRSGYGNCIEIDHGNGLMTRYAHLSRFAARVGEHVAAGARIGAIGSTGRSTGPHLHFEVRVNDRPVNPRPFLEAASRVQQLASAN
jgi:murein DD-endopeptidase MepM/ murein hydrolase activator NlpD